MSSVHAPKAIGGYPELELPIEKSTFPGNAILYQSARAAFRGLLRNEAPKRVFIPRFVCDSIVDPVIDEGIDCVWYNIDDSLNVSDTVSLKKGDFLLYVNYFGMCQAQVDHVLSRFRPEQVVLDYSHAFFDPPRREALATIYSPRKFFGVPDGGILVTDSNVPVPSVDDEDSIARTDHLLKRLYKEPEAGYRDYRRAESTLNDTRPRRMSGLTKRLLESIDYEKVRQQRMENFACLDSSLGDLNEFRWTRSRLKGPLCYPFINDGTSPRDDLVRNRVFVPTYWRDVIERTDAAFASKMVEGLLALPIDQRYGADDMGHVASLVRGEIQ